MPCWQPVQPTPGSSEAGGPAVVCPWPEASPGPAAGPADPVPPDPVPPVPVPPGRVPKSPATPRAAGRLVTDGSAAITASAAATASAAPAGAGLAKRRPVTIFT